MLHFLQKAAIYPDCGHDKMATLPKFSHGNRATLSNCVLGNRAMFSNYDNLETLPDSKDTIWKECTVSKDAIRKRYPILFNAKAKVF